MGERGFSLIEVAIAGAVMIGLAYGAYQLVGNVSMSTADLEKRVRFRDLVEDVRFVFSEPNLCDEAVQGFTFADNTPVSLTLKPGLVLRAGATLAEYGLKVNEISLKNVRTFAGVSRALLTPNGELGGTVTEDSQVGDLYLEVSTLGSNHPLKGQVATRIAITHRKGAVTETLCAGNHPVAAGRGPQPARVTQISTSSAGAGCACAADGAAITPPTPAVQPKPMLGAGQNGGHDECEITDPDMSRVTGRRRLTHGAIIDYKDPQGRLNKVTCDNGKIMILRRD